MKMARPAIVFLTLACGAGFSAHASPPQAAPDPATAVPASASSAADQVVVGIDPKTRKLRPLTAAEMRDLSERAAAMPRASVQWERAPRTAGEAQTTLRKHAGGGVSMRVPTSAMSQLTAQRGADGALRYSENEQHSAHLPPTQARQEISE
ncbi:post-PEP-CTERM-1 domain-containing protein [Luteimonas aquatica]|uniref:post-PEP-CTERM-1 domain-containing protein n=1 Tax=Luteimonas aquatica TaxID=450364 RepID=UPI001F59BED5|nr:hypothetical protein [Luteimonas aquatica]